MHGALFMPDEDVTNIGLVDFVINVQQDAAWKAKNGVHRLLFQHGQKNLCAGHFHDSLTPECNIEFSTMGREQFGCYLTTAPVLAEETALA
jgi:hypothetical protein